MSPNLDRRTFLGVGSAVLSASAIGDTVRAADPPARRALVTGQPEGAEAGNLVFAAGGNAVDAVVAAALVAGVVAVPATGIGGYGGHMVVALPDGKVTAIDFNSTAPAAAKPDMFPVDAKGGVVGRVNHHGWLAAGVPGVLAGLQHALDKFGTMRFSELVKPAIAVARNGFPIRKGLAASIKNASSQFSMDAGSARLFLRRGEPLGEGETFRNPDLADMLGALADQGRVDDFYHGKIAAKIAAGFRTNGGLVTAKDLAEYRAVEIPPLALDWQGHTILTPPPTSGGLTSLQALGILKALNWTVWDRSDFRTVQARVEALRCAWTDRLQHLGDPKFGAVPIERLLSEKYAAECAERVRAALKTGKPVPGRTSGPPAHGTIHLCSVDQRGMMVALTFTHGEAFGAQATVDSLGLILGHGMSRFDPRPNHPNAPGPRKRPLHNMCPMIVLKGGKPVLALGAVGGRRIPNTLFDVLVYYLGEKRRLMGAIAAPRMHTEGDLNLALEAKWPEATVSALKGLGYRTRVGGGAMLNAIARDPATGLLDTAQR